MSNSLHDLREPDGEVAACDMVQQAIGGKTPLYPSGGLTEQSYGNPAKLPGWLLSSKRMRGVVDYPVRDFTITVQAGMTVDEFSALLAGENQYLPIDVPLSHTATIGGAIAAAASGPRRYGYGLPRDYVIGIAGVDGQARLFHGGGRVVKNVAGYDFCKLMTGSRGSLGMITTVTLKLLPSPKSTCWLLASIDQLDQAELLLSSLVNTHTRPCAVQLASRNAASGFSSQSPWTLCVRFEGAEIETSWSTQQLEKEWAGLLSTSQLAVEMAKPDSPSCVVDDRLKTQTDWPLATPCKLMLKFNVLPGAVLPLLQTVLQCDPNAKILASAMSGCLYVACERGDTEFVSKSLVGVLQPAALAGQGAVTVIGGSAAAELTPRARFGNAPASVQWMSKVKQAFDPYGLFNAQRFPW